MKFKVHGRSDGKHVIRFEDDTIEHVNDDGLDALKKKHECLSTNDFDSLVGSALPAPAKKTK